MSIKINISGMTFAKINANLKYLNTYNWQHVLVCLTSINHLLFYDANLVKKKHTNRLVW